VPTWGGPIGDCTTFVLAIGGGGLDIVAVGKSYGFEARRSHDLHARSARDEALGILLKSLLAMLAMMLVAAASPPTLELLATGIANTDLVRPILECLVAADPKATKWKSALAFSHASKRLQASLQRSVRRTRCATIVFVALRVHIVGADDGTIRIRVARDSRHACRDRCLDVRQTS
jgi:hypothetical protein